MEIALSGQDLDAPQALLFSHPGFKAEYVPPPEPPKPDPKKPAPPRPRRRITLPDPVPESVRALTVGMY